MAKGKKYEEARKKQEALIAEKEKKVKDIEFEISFRKRYVKEAKGPFVRTVVTLILLALTAVAVLLAMRSEALLGQITAWLEQKIAAEDAGFWEMVIAETMAEMPGAMEQVVIFGVVVVLCLVLAIVGTGFGGFVLAVLSSGLAFGLMSAYYDKTALLTLIPVVVGILFGLIKLKKRKSDLADEQKRVPPLEGSLKMIQEELEQAKAELAKLDEDHETACWLYEQAKAEKNDELMEKAADLGHEEAQAYLEQQKAKEMKKQAKELYQQAIAGETPDEELMEKAAKLGDPDANLYRGKALVESATTGMYTSREREKLLEKAVKYLRVASADGNTEAQFLEISSRIQYESHNLDDWSALLAQVRKIKNSGKLPEGYAEACDEVIRALVQMVDKMENEQPSYQPSEPKVKRKYCAFNNAGICTRLSTAGYLHHCKYMTDPGDCSTALLDKGLRYEFY